MAFIEATRVLKQRFPLAHVSGGVSNVSFSFRGNNHVREAIHAVFLYHAITAGMDMGIVNAGALALYDDIDPALRDAVEDVVLARHPDATERLLALAEQHRPRKGEAKVEELAWRDAPVDARISHALVLYDDIDPALREAVEDVVLARRPDATERLLALAEQLRTGDTGKNNGKIVMATVKGDVHDIGKNIVGVVLACNNFEVIDLGVMVPAQVILDRAKAENADMIGVSGLITPSLEEMSHVAREMQRQGFQVPLLIGGATTSRAHTALKIDPHYKAATIWVKDASRAVNVAQSLVSPEQRGAFVAANESDYAEIRERHRNKEGGKRLVSLAHARGQRFDGGWDRYEPPQPLAPGITVFDDYPLQDLAGLIDWGPFFNAWELAGRFPAILDDAVVGPQARELFADAQAMLRRIIDERWLTARAVVGLWPARGVGDDVVLDLGDGRHETVHFLRQQADKPPERPDFCLADFIAPEDSGLRDWMGGFAVTAGLGIEAHVARFQAEHDDYNAILLKALADRLAETLAERIHQRVRKELWGYATDESLDTDALIAERYRGIRPAPGYPACPEHSEKATLFRLLDATGHAGMTLTENFAMSPAASVSGWYFSHPGSQYFVVGRVSKEQVADYARRKGIELSAAERLLASNLDYDPE